MINVPSNIKDLFFQNSVVKNYTIHFPNGEHTDITNANLEAESVVFNENLCTSDTIKFGNIENNKISFVAFGIPNIKGCKIEVSVSVNGYSIAIGTFIVDSCKKTSVSVNKRTVIAYSELYKKEISAGHIFDFLDGYSWSGTETLTLTDEDILCSYFDEFADNHLDEHIYKPFSMEPAFSIVLNEFTDANGNIYTLTGKGRSISYLGNIATEVGQKLYRVKADSFSIDNVLTDLRNSDIPSGVYEGYISQYIKIHYALNGYGKLITVSGKDYWEYPEISSDYTDFLSSLNETVIIKNNFVDGSDKRYYYWSASKVTNYSNYALNVFTEFIIKKKSGTTTTTVFDKTTNYPNSFYVGMRSVGVSGRPVLKQKSTKTKISVTRERYDTGAKTKTTREDYKFDLSALKKQYEDVIRSYYELDAKLITTGRNGVFSARSLSVSPVYTIKPSSTIGLWLDDGGTKPFGRVSCNWQKDTSTLVYKYYDVVPGFNSSDYIEYDLSDNYFISNNLFTEAQIESALASFGELIKNIRFMPTNLDCVGLPFLEVGDCVAIETTYGETYRTIILSRTLSGIHSLSDNYVAESNEDYVSLNPLTISSSNVAESEQSAEAIQSQIQSLETGKVSTSFTINNLAMDSGSLNITANTVGAVAVGGNISVLSNDSGYITNSALPKFTYNETTKTVSIS